MYPILVIGPFPNFENPNARFGTSQPTTLLTSKQKSTTHWYASFVPGSSRARMQIGNAQKYTFDGKGNSLVAVVDDSMYDSLVVKM